MKYLVFLFFLSCNIANLALIPSIGSVKEGESSIKDPNLNYTLRDFDNVEFKENKYYLEVKIKDIPEVVLVDCKYGIKELFKYKPTPFGTLISLECKGIGK